MKKKKIKPEIIKLPEEYILRNRYTRFLYKRGKLHVRILKKN